MQLRSGKALARNFPNALVQPPKVRWPKFSKLHDVAALASGDAKKGERGAGRQHEHRGRQHQAIGK
jgi:hypothetical protein